MKIRFLIVTSLLILLTACVDNASVKYGDSHSKPHYENGPPPHAPAHGYRHKHKSHTLEYDSGVGVYVVIGLTDHFFDDGLYFRYRSGNWEVSVNLNSGWGSADERVVPHKLWKSKGHHSRGNSGNKGKGHNKDHPNKGKGKGY